jgi:hypothetical protein
VWFGGRNRDTNKKDYNLAYDAPIAKIRVAINVRIAVLIRVFVITESYEKCSGYRI